MIQTALNWLYDNLYNYMIPVCGLCVLRVVVSLLELGHMKRLRDKKFVFRKVGVQYRDIGAFTGLFIGSVLICLLPKLGLLFAVVAAGLTVLNRLKTGVMISAAAELGCIASEMPATMRAQALVYADAIGRGFQIRDDMLDVEGDQAVFGKPIGSDVQEGKVTFVDVIGMDACRQEVAACTETAKAAVAGWPDHGFLWELADRMVGRRK